jgi:hypothetical protein
MEKYGKLEERFGPNSDKMIILVRKRSVNGKIIGNVSLNNDGG